MKYRQHLMTVCVASLFLAVPVLRAEEPSAAAKALEKLKAGNERFASDKLGPRDLSKARREETAKGQKPFAIILACADSRVAPELVFDQGLGDLFVLRVAGNVADPGEVGSMEFAVAELKTPLIVVMGHSECGAVKGAIEGVKSPENLAALIAKINIGKVSKDDPKVALEAAVKNNVMSQVRLLTTASPVLKDFVQSKRLEIVPAVYSLATGKVEWLDPKAAVKDDPKTEPDKKEPKKEPDKKEPDKKEPDKKEPDKKEPDKKEPDKREPDKKEPDKKELTEKKPALVEVQLPTADARLWFEGDETTSRGPSRVFVSPALPTDRDFKYQIKVTWVDQGKEKTAEKTVQVRGGKTTTVDFTK